MDTVNLVLVQATAGPACDRCRKADRRGLALVRGLRLCGLCGLVATARWRASKLVSRRGQIAP